MAPSNDNGSTPPGGNPPAALPRPSEAGSPLDDVFPVVYEELKRVAHRHLRGERPGHTLGTTALVHEAYLELSKLDHLRWPGRAYTLAAASRAMRRILIDYAVARRAQKRGGGAEAEALDDAVAMAISRSDELLALDEALDRLAAVNERDGRVVGGRFFGGMGVGETL